MHDVVTMERAGVRAVAVASEEFVDESTSYRSCKKMRKYYPRGVAKSTAAGNRARADGFGPAEVNKKVYKANRKLDTNGNRVACEVSAAKARKQFRAELLEKKMPTAEAGEYTENAGYQWRVGSFDDPGFPGDAEAPAARV